MEKLLKLIAGKKAFLFSLFGLIVVYLMSEGIINDNMAILIQGVITLLGGSINIINNGRKK